MMQIRVDEKGNLEFKPDLGKLLIYIKSKDYRKIFNCVVLRSAHPDERWILEVDAHRAVDVCRMIDTIGGITELESLWDGVIHSVLHINPAGQTLKSIGLDSETLAEKERCNAS